MVVLIDVESSQLPLEQLRVPEAKTEKQLTDLMFPIGTRPYMSLPQNTVTGYSPI